MVVAGLGLLFGGRSSRAPLSEEKIRLEGRLHVPEEDSELSSVIADNDADVDDDGTVLLARTVSSAGRSRAWLGGRSVPVGILSEVSKHTLSLHGQSDQMRLLSHLEQRQALDRYAGSEAAEALRQTESLYSALEAAQDKLQRLKTDAEKADREVTALREGLNEIETVDPQSNEEEELAAEARRLENSESLRRAAQGAYATLTGDETTEIAGAIDGAAEAARLLEAESDHDRQLESLGQRVSEANTLLSEATVDLSSYLDDLGSDPHRLEEIYERQAALKDLFRRFAPDIEGVLSWADDARRTIEEYDNSDALIAETDAEVQRLTKEMAASASHLRQLRHTAATDLADKVSAELKNLAMPHAEITAEVTPRPAGRGGCDIEVDGELASVGPDGADEVSLHLRPHPGAPPAPLDKGASGGELSRVMLALEVVFAGVSSPPVLVFDEVDAGVGGQAATSIGQCLATLAKRHQVIVVTHLPQVAAFADTHLVVSKDTSGTVTTSGVRAVADVDRARELARMLAGMPDSHLGVAHAEELLAQAFKSK